MQRKQFLIGLGAASAVGSALVGSGAFSRVESDRDVMIEVAEDPDAYLGLDACDSPYGEEFVDLDDYGHVHVDIGDSEAGGEGVNSNSQTWFDEVFQICNQGTDDAYVWLEHGDDWPVVEEGEYEGEPRVGLYIDGESIVGSENAFELEVGECTCVGIKTNTHGLDASETETLLEDVDDVFTIVADTSEPGEDPPEMAYFEVSDLDPMEATVEAGDMLDVSAMVENTGEVSGEQMIELRLDGEMLDEAMLSLEADESETVSFEDVDTSDLEEGEYTHSIASEDDEASGTLTVEEAEPDPAFFEVSDIDPDEITVEPGDPIDVSATITNTGDEDGEQEIELVIDDNVVDSQMLALDAGEDGEVAFEDVATDDLAEGEYELLFRTEDDENWIPLSVDMEDEWDGEWNRDLDVPIDAEEATNWDNYEVTNVFPTGTIAEEYDLEDGEEGEWMKMDVDPEGRIWVITRGKGFVASGDGYAEVAWVDPDSGEHQLALEIPVIFSGDEVADPGDVSIARELGGQGIAIDPNFEENNYVYIMYHPSSENQEEWPNPYDEDIHSVYQEISRFEFDEESGTLDPDSEEIVYRVPHQQNTCCHHGCYITFGEDREFYISTGDNSNNVGNPDGLVNTFMGDERQGMVHGRPGPVADAQRTSGNTADKRGKVLRIILHEDGTYEDGSSYDVPEGNLKEYWEEETGEEYDDDEFLPEIYVMGLRNPFTITYDDYTGYLWTAHYGNDATSITELGMTGFGDYHLWCEPGNAGYPYFRAYYPYRYYDYETEEVGQPFWPDNLRNRSPNNTGIENIPNVTPALFWHPQSFEDYENATEIHPWLDQPRPGEVTWPEFGTGGSADVGVVYRYSNDYGEGALPPYFDGKPFTTRPSNDDTIYYHAFNDDGSIEINEFGAREGVSAAYDMRVLPDGRLAILGMYSGIHIVEYQGDPPEWEAPPEEEWPERVEPGEEGLSGDPPEDATILWDGEDATLDDWEHPDGSDATWNETSDYFEVTPPTDGGNLQPKDELGDVHLHLEWRVPEEVEGEAEDQGPGNSGLFMMETYEFQILQSYDNPTYPSGHAGSYYKATEGGGSAPLVLPINPPGEWNTYDLFWRGPRFDDDGEVTRLPQATLFFNGVAVQMHLNIPGPVWFDTLYDFDHEDYGHPQNDDGEFVEEAPFLLQDHGNDYDIVQFRNVWYRDLPERPVEESEHPDEIPDYDTSGGDWNEPEQIEPGGVGTTGEPPEDADLLIDDAMTLAPGDGDWESDEAYGDSQIHVEYRIPEDVDGEGPWRGASGVLMMGDYEINIVDNHENPVEAEDWTGAYTHQEGPHHDSVREPGEWQQLDIVWQSPRFSGGELEKPAQVTALLNGVAVQTRLVVDGPNDGYGIGEYSEHAEMPLVLQEDDSEIDFQNVWIREEEAELVDDDEPSEPELLSAPFGLDLGGTHTEDTVEIDGLEFLPTAEQSEDIAIDGENRPLEDDEIYWPDTVSIEPNPNESPGATSEDRPLNEEEDLGTEPDIEGTDYDSMYWTEQWGAEELTYTFDIENGVYEVTLHFAEVWFADEDTRVFSGSVNGETLFEELDLYADHGPDTAVTFSHVVDVEDEEIVVELESSVENPKISGIEIREVDKVAHYDASALELEDGDAVSEWPDAEGVGPTLTQDDEDAQPTFQEDVANGNPTVRFEGDSDFINVDEVVTDSTAGVTMAAAFSSHDPTLERQTIVFNGSDGDLNGYGVFVNNEESADPASDGSVHGLYGGVNWWWSDTTVEEEQFHVVTWTIPEDAPDEPVLRLDGEELETESQNDEPGSPETPTEQFGIGQDNNSLDPASPPYLDGDVGEVRVYDRELSGGELEDLESELTDKWVGDENGGEIPEDAIEPGTAIELEGVTSGWVGIAPDSIEGDENPTLTLVEGESYELGWTTGDGGNHNLAIRDEDEEVVDDLATEITGDPDDEWLEFEATTEMVEYVCEPHQGQMVGDIEIV